MKKLLNPVSNAKVVGVLLIISSIFEIIENTTLLANTSIQFLLLVSTIVSLFSIGIGWGMVRTKKWGLYGFIALTAFYVLYSLGYLFSKPSTFVLLFSTSITLVFILLSIWFYKAKERFQ